MMISRLAAAAALVAALAAPAVAAEYNLDLNHTQAEFSVVHLGFSHVRGLIPVTAGTLVLDGSNVPTSVTATLNAAGLDTKSADRDSDLRGAEWFETEKYPTMSFVSTRIEGTNPQAFTIAGNLTMHGVTKPVTLAAKFEGRMVDARGRAHVAYSATTTVDRRDFNLNWGKTAPGGGLVAAYDVTISLSVEAVAASS
jgi:polyisoprenoid-binding protein YceI